MADAVVLDEVDVMVLDTSFPLNTIGNAATSSEVQFIFVTATMPVEVADQLKREFPGIKLISGPGLHRLSPLVSLDVIDCTPPSSDMKERQDLTRGGEKGRRKRNEQKAEIFDAKRKALVQLLDQNLARDTVRTLLFCNSVESARALENGLKRSDRKNQKWLLIPHHSAISERQRQENLACFARSDRAVLRPMLLICTDRAGRGVDFGGSSVGHVVLWDWPRDPSEFLRRVGRTARAGSAGRVTVFVSGPQVPLARRVIDSARSGARLAEVPTRNSELQDLEDR